MLGIFCGHDWPTKIYEWRDTRESSREWHIFIVAVAGICICIVYFGLCERLADSNRSSEHHKYTKTYGHHLYVYTQILIAYHSHIVIHIYIYMLRRLIFFYQFLIASIRRQWHFYISRGLRWLRSFVCGHLLRYCNRCWWLGNFVNHDKSIGFEPKLFRHDNWRYWCYFMHNGHCGADCY